MILRKPYAFLIKNFKLLHAIITVLMGYTLYKTYNIISFFGDYIISSQNIIGENIVETLYNLFMFISPIFVIIISIILLVVMIVKKKPSVLYIINILIYIYVLIVFLISKSTILQLEITLLDIRKIKLVRDLTTLSLMVQIYPIIKSFVRTVGFDIKQFDFGKDLAELEIEEKDNEEFEVNVSVDTNKMKRNVNSKTRISKYIYAENKFLINSIIVIIILIVVGITSFNIFRGKELTNMNTSFVVNGLRVKVLNSYSTRKDYKGIELVGLDSKKSLVVVPVNLKNTSSVDKQLTIANIELDIGEHRFRHSEKYRDSLFELGLAYNGELISSQGESNYILIFEVPTTYLDDEIYIKFITSISIKGKDLIPTYVTVPLELRNLDAEKDINEIKNNEQLSLNDSVLGDTLIKIDSIDISKRFKVDYNYCISSSDCLPSYEYLLAELNTNVDKSLMKITGSVTYDENNKISSLNYLYDLINYFGNVRYEIDGQVKTVSSGLTKVNPTFLKSNTTIYVSVPSEIEQAEHIDLILNIRDKQYVYSVK